MITILRSAQLVLTSAYLLGFPLIFFALLIGLPLAAFRSNARALLSGLFDIQPDVLGMAIVTLTSLGAAWAIMLTSWLILAYGGVRFGVPFLHVVVPFRLWLPVMSCTALPVILTALVETRRQGKRPLKPLLLGVTTGIVAALVLLRIAASLRGPEFEHSIAPWLSSMPNLAAGYVDARDPANPALLPYHGLALSLFLLLFIAYAVIGGAKYARLGGRRTLPTLGYVLLLLMLLCWGLSGAAFFFDHYRIPVLLLVGGLAVLTSLSSRSDHYYEVLPRCNTDRLAPAMVIRGDASRDRAIVVAANGGGIQAAVWTARVLTGLELRCRSELHTLEFGRSIRLISSVSGGSVGSMYFVDAYSEHGLPESDQRVEEIARRAETSLLDAVAWGLVYPDFWRQIFPAVWNKKTDRGRALEVAITAECARLSSALGEWRTGVREGWRPGNIFNATISDTGERLLMSTTDLVEDPAADAIRDPIRGRREFYDLYPEHDVSVVTAARLSSTFPYVSPAARANLPGPQPHVIDGGYYDNYGISTLLDWLDQALLSSANPIRRVLLVEIRGAPFDEMMIRSNKRGWFYQAFAPIATTLHVRTTGQAANADLQVSLFERLYKSTGVKIDPVLFEFHEPKEEQNRHAGPPLSWHLTARQKQDIQDAWRAELVSGKGWPAVKRFLMERS